MSPAVEKLKELEQRLVAATGADREIDAAIARAFWPNDEVESDDGDWWMGRYDELPVRVPSFTASLDAAVALCSRVLPGWHWMISTADGGGYVVDIAPDGCPGGGPTVEHNATAQRTQGEIGMVIERVESKGIYVASRVRHAEMWRKWRDNAGVPIISTWIDEAGEGETGDFSELWARITAEVLSCERVVFFASQGDPPFKGAFIEIGIALGAGIPVTVVLDQIELEPRSCRPIGSWINHPLVKIQPALVQALTASHRAALSEHKGA